MQLAYHLHACGSRLWLHNLNRMRPHKVSAPCAHAPLPPRPLQPHTRPTRTACTHLLHCPTHCCTRMLCSAS